VRTDGLPVFNTLTDIANNIVFNPPSLDENGVDRGAARTWTGSTPSGQAATVCSGFAGGGTLAPWAGDPTGSGTFGVTNFRDSRVITTQTQSCASQAHLLCLGVGRVATVTP
jgi:hypothetical protein